MAKRPNFPMNAHEKLDVLTALLQKYAGQDEMFAASSDETSRQKLFREDLHAAVSVIFNDNVPIRADMSAADMKESLKKAWEQTRPSEWS